MCWAALHVPSSPSVKSASRPTRHHSPNKRCKNPSPFCLAQARKNQQTCRTCGPAPSWIQNGNPSLRSLTSMTTGLSAQAHTPVQSQRTCLRDGGLRFLIPTAGIASAGQPNLLDVDVVLVAVMGPFYYHPRSSNP